MMIRFRSDNDLNLQRRRNSDCNTKAITPEREPERTTINTTKKIAPVLIQTETGFLVKKRNGHVKTIAAAKAFGSPNVPTARPPTPPSMSKLKTAWTAKQETISHAGNAILIREEMRAQARSNHRRKTPCMRNGLPKSVVAV